MINKKINEQAATKILIVDDKMENLIALEKTLTPLHLNVFKANSGNEALKLMLDNEFAVVLLDVMMPGMDGFEVATLMHQNDATKYIPIVFLTAINKSEKYYIQGMEAGAIDYLYKPIEPVILLSKVRIFVDLYNIRNALNKTIDKLNLYQEKLETTNKQLKQLAEEDGLTQIANRRHFENEFQRLVELERQHQQGLALIFCDVDDFKSINDTYGHSVGDLVLKTLAERIRQLVNENDAAVAHIKLDVIARLGGDEFAILIGNLNKQINNAEIVAQKMLAAIQTPVIYKDNKIVISISVGIACSTEAGSDVTQLMQAADEALYLAKQAGKNRYVMFKKK